MKLIDKYIFKKSVLPYIYSLLLFLILIVVIDVFENLDSMLKNKVSLGMVFKYYMFLVPNYLSQISPTAILLATLFIIGNMLRHNEITAMRAVGINLWRIILPFLVIGFLFSVFIIVFNETVLPKCIYGYRVIKERYIKTDSKEKKFYKKNIAVLSGDYSYLIKKYDVERKEMNDITILKYSKAKDVISRIDAKRAEWTGLGWRIYNGSIREFEENKEASMNLFEEKFLSFLEKPDFFKKIITIDLMSGIDLYRHIKRLKANGYRPVKEVVALHSKAAFPFANFVVLLIGIPVIFLFSNMGLVFGIIMSLVITFLYRIVVVVGVSLGNAEILSPWMAAWFGNLMFLFVGLMMVSRIRR